MNAMRLPTKSELKQIEEKYPKGCRIELVDLKDPFSTIPPGTKGTVIGVNILGDLDVAWDNGSSLSIILAVDKVRKL